MAGLLLDRGLSVHGLDNLNDYYDVRIKKHRLAGLRRREGFTFTAADIEDRKKMFSLFSRQDFSAVINLAARAGVRSSMENPHVYMSTNAAGTLNLLDLCREKGIKKFVLASTSSLYAGQKMPFSEELPVNTPISPYAASKKAAEVMAYTYSYLYGLNVSVLRYFTVYGPAGRPDMSVFRFIRWIDEGRPLELFGDGSQSRDFTYVTDVARGTASALKLKGFNIINLGGSSPHTISAMIRLIEKNLGKKAAVRKLPFHMTDMKATWADTAKAARLLSWKPSVGLEEGIRLTVEWYLKNKRWLLKVKL